MDCQYRKSFVSNFAFDYEIVRNNNSGMKKFLSLMLIILLFTSCILKPDEGGILDKVEFNVEDSLESIGIFSSEYRGITHYQIDIEDNGKVIAESDYLPLSNSYIVNEIREGTYNVIASGLVKEGDNFKKLSEKRIEVEFDTEHDAFPVLLENPASLPSGNLSISISLPVTGILNWEIREGIGLDGTLVNFGKDNADTGNVYTFDFYSDGQHKLDGGIYTFIVSIEDESGNILAKDAEALTVFPGIDTTGSISFDRYSGSATAECSKNDIYTLASGFDGVNMLLSSGTSFLLSSDSAAEVTWYIDGKEIGKTKGKEKLEITAAANKPFLVEGLSVNGNKLDYFAFPAELEVHAISGTPEISVAEAAVKDEYEVGDLVSIDGVRSYIAYIPSHPESWGDYLVAQEYDLHHYIGSMLGEYTLEKYKGTPWEAGVRYENPHETGVEDESIGAGLENTNALIDLIPSSDSLWCYVDLFRKAAGDKWFVPSKLELRELYNNRDKVKNFSTEMRYLYLYWSSTESRPYSSCVISFYTGSDLAQDKLYLCGVRLCRYVTKEELDKQTVSVTITPSDPDAEIRYTIDGSIPSADSLLYKGPFAVEDGCVINAREFSSGKLGGDIVSISAIE